jgi:toxin HigB-1
MIRSFKSKEAEKIFSRQRSTLIPEDIQRFALRELRLLDQAQTVKESWATNGNGNGSGEKDGSRYAIPFHDQWSICFEWRDGDAFDVYVAENT